MYICLVSSTKLVNNCYDKYFLQGNTNVGHNAKFNISTICFSLIVEDSLNFLSKAQELPKTSFATHHFFERNFYTQKN
jgi:hypothetical protein